MTRTAVDRISLDSLKTIVTGHTGMEFEQVREQIFTRRVSGRLQELRLTSLGGYLDYLKNRLATGDHRELEMLITDLTVNETSFFRDPGQFRYLQQVGLPGLAANDTITILSAACASGEETWSLAMTARECFGDQRPPRLLIEGFDIDGEALELARRAVYPAAVRNFQKIDAWRRDKYFEKTADGYRVRNNLRDLVAFKRHNFVVDRLPGPYDIIFCKNVMIYFTDAVKERVVADLLKALNPNGLLFLGATEFIRPLPVELVKVEYPGGRAYRKIAETKPAVTVTRIAALPRPDRPVTPAPPVFMAAITGLVDEEESPNTYRAFLNIMDQIMTAEQPRSILDCTGIRFISRTAIAALAKVTRYQRHRGRELILIIPSGSVQACISRHLDTSRITVCASLADVAARENV